MEDKEEIDTVGLEKLKEDAKNDLSEYLKSFTPADTGSMTKSSIMGPVGKLLSAINSGKATSSDGLVGYTISIHNQTGKSKISKEATAHLENGIKKLIELKQKTPKSMWMKTLRDLDYAIYKNKLAYIIQRSEEKKENEGKGAN
jgi:hypothetical protein